MSRLLVLDRVGSAFGYWHEVVDDEAHGVGVVECVIDRAPADVACGFGFGDDGSVFLAEGIAASFAHGITWP